MEARLFEERVLFENKAVKVTYRWGMWRLHIKPDTTPLYTCQSTKNWNRQYGASPRRFAIQCLRRRYIAIEKYQYKLSKKIKKLDNEYSTITCALDNTMFKL